jgi:hypothetical protein
VALLRRLGAVAVLACVLAGAAAAGDYHNTAQALMPTPQQVSFAQVIEFKKAKQPAAKLARGWKSGVAAIFEKGTTKAPVEAAITAFIYASAADAKTAWLNACPKCAHMLVNGIQFRYAAGKQNGLELVELFTACRNVYTNVVTEGSESQTKLVGDAELIGFAIYKRANHFGMSACK